MVAYVESSQGGEGTLADVGFDEDLREVRWFTEVDNGAFL